MNNRQTLEQAFKLISKLNDDLTHLRNENKQLKSELKSTDYSQSINFLAEKINRTNSENKENSDKIQELSDNLKLIPTEKMKQLTVLDVERTIRDIIDLNYVNKLYKG